MKRVLKWVIALVILLGLGGGAYAYKQRHTEDPIKYKTVAIDKGRVAASVTATGTISARVTVQVGSQVSGTIQALFADFNTPVKKGQVVARIDPRLFQAAVDNVRANVVQNTAALHKAQANVLQAQRAFDRAKSLKEQNLMTEADYETAETGLIGAKADEEVAKSNLDQANASMNTANINLGFTTIISPIDGIVISRSVDTGQTVAASLSAPTLFTIAQDLTLLQVDTYVAEADVGKLAPGMNAKFTVDAYPGQKFTGKVREVRNAATTVQNVVTYDAVLDVENPDLRLKPGMTANVTFVWAQKNDAIRVPNAALRYHPSTVPQDKASTAPSGSVGPGGRRQRPPPDAPQKRTAWILKGGKPTASEVELGVTDGSYTEVVNGLALGDQIITDEEGGEPPPTATKPAANPLGGGGGGGGGRGGR